VTNGIRERLDAVIETHKGETVGRQIRAIAELAIEFPHRIRLVCEAIPEEPDTRFTCFDFALDLRGAEDVKMIAADQPKGSPLYPSPEFVQYLIAECLEEAPPGNERAGDLVIYSNGRSITHAGLLVAPDLVISKWGLMHLWVHGTLEVPARYGSEVRYFKRPSRAECVKAFLAFVKWFSLLASPAALAVALAFSPVAIVVPFVFPFFPFPLVRPFASPLVTPSRRLLLLPLLPVPRGHAVIVHRHQQDGPGHELRGDDDPRAVVSGAHVPATIGKGPVLVAVEEEIGGGGRHVLDRSNLGDDDQLRGRREMDADVDVHLSVGRRSEDDGQQREDNHVHECSSCHARPERQRGRRAVIPPLRGPVTCPYVEYTRLDSYP
jgi:hypothetical protein